MSARGYEAYLVGGCVRDLLLGLEPKDYDIATAARPPQVKRTFPRNCRIIGRRFKLAHLHFHDNTKILELSTFRRTPQMENAEDDLLITRDNEFGNAEEDALRRDFTVNALFLDPTRDRILDFADGLADVRAKVIRTIGDPRVRFREDPVRILRAAKFAGRLGFQVHADTQAAMAETAPDLIRAAPPRLLEEILRLLRGGHALDSFQLLRDVGAVKSLLPVVAEFLAEAPLAQRVAFWRTLDALDHRVLEHGPPANPVLLGTLFVGAVSAQAERSPDRSPSTVAEELLGPLSQTLRLPRRDAGCLKRICGVQHRFLQDDQHKRFKVPGFVHGPYFAEALDLFELRTMAEGLDQQLLHKWRELGARAGVRPMGEFDDNVTAAAGESDDTEPVVADQSIALSDDPAGAQRPADGRADAGEVPGDGQRRRRRRRRRRGGQRHDDQRGEFAPAGGMAARDDQSADDMLVPQTPDAAFVVAAGEIGTPGDTTAETSGRGDDDERPAGAGDPDADQFVARPDRPFQGEPGEGGRRRRRRRRRRGGGGGGEQRPPHTGPGGRAVPADDHVPHPPGAAEPALASGPQGHGHAPPGEGRRRGRRGRRNRGRDDDQQRRHHHGGNRDVDVVPRYRDRRGKVEVLDPPPLDLSAFDVELDPKRVPTFGSIVE
ncbi:MAG TPA: polynucleotide adenylyltransferase PcnB, partial [Planctomycetota bacterium]|nr:polynucleotide adenylyltransferase PcnB [Planctomycetota bacterium]